MNENTLKIKIYSFILLKISNLFLLMCIFNKIPNYIYIYIYNYDISFHININYLILFKINYMLIL